MGKKRNARLACDKELDVLELTKKLVSARTSAADETLAPKARKYYRRNAAGLRRLLRKLEGR
jgi:hypothetical protein